MHKEDRNILSAMQSIKGLLMSLWDIHTHVAGVGLSNILSGHSYSCCWRRSVKCHVGTFILMLLASVCKMSCRDIHTHVPGGGLSNVSSGHSYSCCWRRSVKCLVETFILMLQIHTHVMSMNCYEYEYEYVMSML